MRIEDQLRFLKRMRSSLDEQIDLLEEARVLHRPWADTNRMSSVIESAAIKPYIQEWVDGGISLHALARKAGCAERSIRTIMSGEVTYTTLPVAEKILVTGLGLPHIYLELAPPIEPPDPPPTHCEE